MSLQGQDSEISNSGSNKSEVPKMNTISASVDPILDIDKQNMSSKQKTTINRVKQMKTKEKLKSLRPILENKALDIRNPDTNIDFSSIKGVDRDEDYYYELAKQFGENNALIFIK